MPVITIKKIPLVHKNGDAPPSHVGIKGKRRDLRENWDDELAEQGYVVSDVSIAALEVDGAKYAQYRVMSGCMAIPDNLCWFYVEFKTHGE